MERDGSLWQRKQMRGAKLRVETRMVLKVSAQIRARLAMAKKMLGKAECEKSDARGVADGIPRRCEAMTTMVLTPETGRTIIGRQACRHKPHGDLFFF